MSAWTALHATSSDENHPVSAVNSEYAPLNFPPLGCCLTRI